METNNDFSSIVEQTDEKENVFNSPTTFIATTKSERRRQAGLFPMEKQTKLDLLDDCLGWRVPTGLTQMPEKRRADDGEEMKETPAEKKRRLKKEEVVMARELRGMLGDEDKKTDDENKGCNQPVEREDRDFVDLTSGDEIRSTGSYDTNRSEGTADVNGGVDGAQEEADPASHMFRAARFRWNGESLEFWLDEDFTNRILDGFWAA